MILSYVREGEFPVSLLVQYESFPVDDWQEYSDDKMRDNIFVFSTSSTINYQIGYNFDIQSSNLTNC